ncbi:MAG: hypothetical protein RIT07_469 [Bacteroidota bacterium]|jgi:hypothetical protein
MRIIAVFLCVSAGVFSAKAQTAARAILSSTGGSYSGTFSADWTVGNLVGETGSTTNNLFTQGFQQPIIVQPTNSLLQVLNSPVNLTPNPSGGDALLNWSTMPTDAVVLVYNTTGALVHESIWQAGQSHVVPGKLWLPGVYQIAVLCDGNRHMLKYVRF